VLSAYNQLGKAARIIRKVYGCDVYMNVWQFWYWYCP